jgi:hypothetical protein
MVKRAVWVGKICFLRAFLIANLSLLFVQVIGNQASVDLMVKKLISGC